MPMLHDVLYTAESADAAVIVNDLPPPDRSKSVVLAPEETAAPAFRAEVGGKDVGKGGEDPGAGTQNGAVGGTKGIRTNMPVRQRPPQKSPQFVMSAQNMTPAEWERERCVSCRTFWLVSLHLLCANNLAVRCR